MPLPIFPSHSVVNNTEMIGGPIPTSASLDDPNDAKNKAEELRRADEYKELFDFDTARGFLQQLKNAWGHEITRTEYRRQLRTVELDVDAMRKVGELESDETFVPMRIIDENIKREQPSYMSFLTQPQHLMYFIDVLNPSADTSQLAEQFTKGMKYPNWEKAWYKEIDGAAAHGWDAVEVIYDEGKPLGVGLEQIGHDRLFFSWDSFDIQSSPHIIRQYALTSIQLRKFVKDFGFNKAEVERCIEGAKLGKESQKNLTIYKDYFKFEGLVYVAWFALDYSVQTWLKAPEPFYNGVKKPGTKMVPVEVPVVDPTTGLQSTMVTQQPQPSIEDVYEQMYPVFILPYSETENPRITDTKGRVFFDSNKQESITAVATGFINALTRSTGIYAAPKNPTGTGSLPKTSDVKIEAGRIMTEPMDFFNMPMPDAPSILSAMQYFDNRNSAQMGQFTEALRAKKGEKTATEYQTAQQDTAFLNSVPMALFSKHVREVYTYAFRIVRSRAMFDLVPLLATSDSEPYNNDKAILGRAYDLRASGDVEVIQKMQKVDKMMQVWPIIANTPLASTYLTDLLLLLFPESGQRYKNILTTGDPSKILITSLVNTVKGFVMDHPESVAQLAPQEQQAFKQLMQQSVEFVQGGPQQSTGTEPVNQPQPEE